MRGIVACEQCNRWFELIGMFHGEVELQFYLFFCGSDRIYNFQCCFAKLGLFKGVIHYLDIHQDGGISKSSRKNDESSCLPETPAFL